MSNCYTIRYPRIPIDCLGCAKDLLHHNLYHIKYHESCKFCLQLAHKLKASTSQDFQKEVKSQARYHGCICPLCDKQFVERYARDKHVEYAHAKTRIMCQFCEKNFATEDALNFFDKLKRDKHVVHAHGSKRFVCGLCEETFASKQAFMYHEDTVHKKTSPVKCKMCSLCFTSLVSLKNHEKYVHSKSS